MFKKDNQGLNSRKFIRSWWEADLKTLRLAYLGFISFGRNLIKLGKVQYAALIITNNSVVV